MNTVKESKKGKEEDGLHIIDLDFHVPERNGTNT